MLTPLRGTLSPLGMAIATATPWWLSGGISSSACVAAYQPKGAASLAASYSNLANPGTYDAAPGVAPTWDVTNGWIFDGLTQYLDTGIVPASGYSALVRFSGVLGSGGSLFGSNQQPGSYFAIRPYSSSVVIYYSGGLLLVSPYLSAGVLGIAGQQGYRAGVADGGAIGSWTQSSSYAIVIGARRASGPIINDFRSGNIQCLSFYQSTLSDTQMLALATAMAAL